MTFLIIIFCSIYQYVHLFFVFCFLFMCIKRGYLVDTTVRFWMPISVESFQHTQPELISHLLVYIWISFITTHTSTKFVHLFFCEVSECVQWVHSEFLMKQWRWKSVWLTSLRHSIIAKIEKIKFWKEFYVLEFQWLYFSWFFTTLQGIRNFQINISKN